MRRRDNQYSSKYGVGPDPLEKESRLSFLKPRAAHLQAKVIQVIDDLTIRLRDDPGGAKRQALTLYKTQLMMNEEFGHQEYKWVLDFWKWLLGRGEKSDHDKTSWGRQNVAAVNKEVGQYVSMFVEKRTEFISKLALLAMRQPTTLNEYYLYFKYVVRGGLKRVTEGEKTYFDFSDEDFLQDWDVLIAEFDEWKGQRANPFDPDQPRDPFPYGEYLERMNENHTEHLARMENMIKILCTELAQERASSAFSPPPDPTKVSAEEEIKADPTDQAGQPIPTFTGPASAPDVKPEPQAKFRGETFKATASENTVPTPMKVDEQTDSDFESQPSRGVSVKEGAIGSEIDRRVEQKNKKVKELREAKIAKARSQKKPEPEPPQEPMEMITGEDEVLTGKRSPKQKHPDQPLKKRRELPFERTNDYIPGQNKKDDDEFDPGISPTQTFISEELRAQLRQKEEFQSIYSELSRIEKESVTREVLEHAAKKREDTKTAITLDILTIKNKITELERVDKELERHVDLVTPESMEEHREGIRDWSQKTLAERLLQATTLEGLYKLAQSTYQKVKDEEYMKELAQDLLEVLEEANRKGLYSNSLSRKFLDRMAESAVIADRRRKAQTYTGKGKEEEDDDEPISTTTTVPPNEKHIRKAKKAMQKLVDENFDELKQGQLSGADLSSLIDRMKENGDLPFLRRNRATRDVSDVSSAVDEGIAKAKLDISKIDNDLIQQIGDALKAEYERVKDPKQAATKVKKNFKEHGRLVEDLARIIDKELKKIGKTEEQPKKTKRRRIKKTKQLGDPSRTEAPLEEVLREKKEHSARRGN